MPYITGTGLGGATGGPSAIIEAIRTEIDAKMTGTKGTDWIERRYTGTVAGQNREYWVEIPAAKTFNGRRLIIGFAETPAGTLAMNTSHLDWTSMTTGTGAGTFKRMDGQPMDKSSGDIDAATQDAAAPQTGTQLLATGAAYINHWIITSTGFGTNSPSAELALYFVVEVSAGRYVKGGFWEIEQFGDWSADSQDGTAGHGIALDSPANEYSAHPDTGGSHAWFCSSAYQLSSTAQSPRAEPATFYIPHSKAAKWGSNFSHWPVIGGKDITTDSPRASIIGLDRGFGRNAGSNSLHDHLRGVSVATGIAQRLPAKLWMSDTGDMRPNGDFFPIGSIPLLYWVNISALNPGSIETFGGEDFLVVPVLEKNLGAIDTGNDGMLFRL